MNIYRNPIFQKNLISLINLKRLAQTHESTIAFQHLLESCAKQCQWLLIQEQTLKRSHFKRIRIDGVLFDSSNLG
jgi:hypothetical protein